jgi:hypothetical protein
MKPIVNIEEQANQYHRLAGLAATLSRFAPFFENGEIAVAKLKIMLNTINSFSDVQDEITNRDFVMQQCEKTIALFLDEFSEPNDKLTALYGIYMIATAASFALQDHFGFISKTASYFSSRAECIEYGWHLGTNKLLKDQLVLLENTIKKHFENRKNIKFS